jgi:beta-alanine degradation protein BauB
MVQQEENAGKNNTPAGSKVLLENNLVRVIEIWIEVGGRTDLHFHPPNVVYSLCNGRAKFTNRDGRSMEAEIKQGEAVFSEGGWHIVENLGPTDIRAVHFELKNTK